MVCIWQLNWQEVPNWRVAHKGCLISLCLCALGAFLHQICRKVVHVESCKAKSGCPSLNCTPQWIFAHLSCHPVPFLFVQRSAWRPLRVHAHELIFGTQHTFGGEVVNVCVERPVQRVLSEEVQNQMVQALPCTIHFHFQNTQGCRQDTGMVRKVMSTHTVWMATKVHTLVCWHHDGACPWKKMNYLLKMSSTSVHSSSPQHYSTVPVVQALLFTHCKQHVHCMSIIASLASSSPWWTSLSSSQQVSLTHGHPRPQIDRLCTRDWTASTHFAQQSV